MDAPAAAVSEAERLVVELMQAMGYPMGDFEQRAADISVDRPHVIEHYRVARGIAQANERGEDVSTEDLRQALRRYRSFFDRLLSI